MKTSLKKFLFISHITPRSKRSALRQSLFDLMYHSLNQQTYTNWKALWIGENERLEGNIKEVCFSDGISLSDIYSRKDVVDYIEESDYIIKLDDDDIIMPDTLKRASELEYDCYCDLYHTFYDVSSGILTQQKRSWIAATCIHKKEHAVKHLNGQQKAENFVQSLFYGEHGHDWINYYKHKKIVYTEKENPVYVRILSPTSRTAGARIFPVKSFNDIDLKQYHNYLVQFGSWRSKKINGFNKFEKELMNAWRDFSNLPFLPIKSISFNMKVKDVLKSILYGK